MVRLATCRVVRSRCVQSMSATHHSYSTSTRTRPLPAHRHPESLPERAPDGLRPSGPRNRVVHAARNALVDRPELRREFSSQLVTKISFCDFVWRPTSDTPVALPTRPRAGFFEPKTRVLVRCTMLQVAPDRFYPESRDALRAFAIRGAFPRQAIHDSACPLRTPIMNRRRPRDFAHLASDRRLRFTLRLTPVAFAPPRSFLW